MKNEDYSIQDKMSHNIMQLHFTLGCISCMSQHACKLITFWQIWITKSIKDSMKWVLGDPGKLPVKAKEELSISAFL